MPIERAALGDRDDLAVGVTRFCNGTLTGSRPTSGDATRSSAGMLAFMRESDGAARSSATEPRAARRARDARGAVRLGELTDVSAAVAATRSRKAKTEAIAGLLAGAAPGEVAAAVAFLSGGCPSARSASAGRRCASRRRPRAGASLTVAEVDAAFGAIGALARAPARRPRGATALARAARPRDRAPSSASSSRLLLGELRQGALAGVMADAVAAAAGRARGRRAPGADAARRPAAVGRGRAAPTAPRASRDSGSQVGRPLAPMLAETAADVGRALETLGPAAVEWKLDGARIQVHRDGDEVAVFTRTLDDVTARVPEVVEAALGAAGARGSCSTARRSRCAPTAGRTRSRSTAQRFGEPRRRRAPRRELPLTRSSSTCCTSTARTCSTSRWPSARAALDARSPEPLRVPRSSTGDAAAAAAFLDDALAARPRGRDGEGARRALRGRPARRRRGSRSSRCTRSTSSCSPSSGATAGASGWLSQPPPRRARRPTGGFVMLGKTFKGLTDEMLAWQTEQLLELDDRPRRPRRPRAPGARRRDRVRRRPGEPALPGRRGAALRARQALPRRQARERGRHDRHGPGDRGYCRGMSLSERTLFITGASRGIGLAIALRAARDGANVAIAAKTAEPQPEAARHDLHRRRGDRGGRRQGAADASATSATRTASRPRSRRRSSASAASTSCVNNASAISLTDARRPQMKRYDLMHEINTRGTFLVLAGLHPAPASRPTNPHVLKLSPPLELDPRWFAAHVAYTMAKFGMSMCTLGMAEEFARHGIAVNCLWPRTVDRHRRDPEPARRRRGDGRAARTPEIMADAAYAIFNQPARECTGNFFIDDEVLATLADPPVTDLGRYHAGGEGDSALLPDFFVDPGPLSA